MPGVRLFIAVKVIPEKETLYCFHNLKKQIKGKVSWVPVENWHVTLVFIGKCKKELISSISASMDEVSGSFSGFESAVSGLGCFRKRNAASAIWFGIQDDKKNFASLSQAICQKLPITGIKKADGFMPHLTIGRIRGEVNDQQLRELEMQYSKLVFQKLRVEEFILYNSDLTPRGAVYTSLRKTRLNPMPPDNG